jgi:hypothetical protein
LINKRRLPEDLSQLSLPEQIKFPIENMNDIQQFFQTVPTYYQLPDPLPVKYANFNYTEKQDLPQDFNQVTKVNLTLPIMTPKELTIAARALKKFYYFHKIPEEWIKIPKKPQEINLDRQLPNTNEELNNLLKTKENLITDIIFPITDQSNIFQAIELLKQHFDLINIPNFLFNVNDLPPPQWNLFDDYNANNNNSTQDISMEDHNKKNFSNE